MGVYLLDGCGYRTSARMGSKKNSGIVRPILTGKCKQCGKWFTKSHPKSTQELCERCRQNERNTEGR